MKVRELSFGTLEMQDFKSFQGLHKFRLDRAYGLHFIRGKNVAESRLGSNGAGKSSLWDAVCWCLFGVTPGGLKNPDVRPWVGGKATQVVVRLWVDGKPHRIARTASPNTLELDDEGVGQEKINRLLRMNFDIFTNTVILGQARPLFFDLSPRDKMQLFTDAMMLDRWDARSKYASKEAEGFELEHSMLSGEILGLEASLKVVSDLCADIQTKREAWEKEWQDRTKQTGESIASLEKKLEVKQKKLDAADLSYDGCSTEVRALTDRVSNLKARVRAHSVNHSASEMRHEELTVTIGAAQVKIKDLLKSKYCPTCGNAVEPGDLKKHRREIADEIEKLEELRSVQKQQRDQYAGHWQADQKILDRETKSLKDFTRRADNAQSEVNMLKPEVATLVEKIAAAKVQRKGSESEVNPYVDEARKLIKKERRATHDLADAKDDLLKCAADLDRAKFWTKGFKEIKLHIIQEVLQDLELMTAGMLEEVGLIGWRVEYVVEHETKSGTTHRGLTVMIGSPKSKGLVRWESWSGGEGQRLRVVGALALSAVLLNYAGVTSDMEVLDEPTQHLSDEGIHDLCDYLSDRARTSERVIYYCDQQSVDSAAFISTILINRDKGGSHIGAPKGAA